MGVRIKRAIGYGLVDVTADDPRINWKQLEKVREEFDFEGFMNFCKQREASVYSPIKEMPTPVFCQYIDLPLLQEMPATRDFGRCFLHDEECGEGTTFVVVNPLNPNHARYNDDLDYYSEIMLLRALEEAGRSLPGGEPAATVKKIIAGLQARTMVIPGWR